MIKSAVLFWPADDFLRQYRFLYSKDKNNTKEFKE